MRNSLHVSGTNIASSDCCTPMSPYSLLNLIDELVGISTVQVKNFSTRKQVFADRDRAVVTDDEREIAPLGIPWFWHQIKRRREMEVDTFCNQCVIALMIICSGSERMECHSPEKLAAVFLTCNSPST